MTLVAGLTCFGGSVGAILDTAPVMPTEAAAPSGGAKASASASVAIDVPAAQIALLTPADDAATGVPGDAAVSGEPDPEYDEGAVHLILDIGPGDTLSVILGRGGVEPGQSAAAIAALRNVFDPRSLRAGKTVALTFASGRSTAKLTALALAADARHQVTVSRGRDGGYSASMRDLATERSAFVAGGAISSSLYADAAKAGVPDAIIAEFIRAFSWDVDFQRDLHQGDRFSVMFEQLEDRDGVALGTGDLIYARLVLGGRPRGLYRYVSANGEAGFYTPEGMSARKELLRTPVDGARLSSQFGMRRHPILGYSRMHRGIDFAAPTGTPIYAAGDGRISFIGRNKGYGNYIRIEHSGGYATAYGHLSRFARGVRPDSTVKQGQVIGQVGSTGMSTGPHLHYEFIVDGEQVNPLEARAVTQVHLHGEDRARFAAAMATVDRQFAALGHDTAVNAAR